MHNNKNGRGGVQKYEQVSQKDESEIIIFQTTKKIQEVSFRCFGDKDSSKWLVDISPKFGGFFEGCCATRYMGQKNVLDGKPKVTSWWKFSAMKALCVEVWMKSKGNWSFVGCQIFFHVCFSLKSRGKGWFRFCSLARFLQVCLHCRRRTFQLFLPSSVLFDVQLTREASGAMNRRLWWRFHVQCSRLSTGGVT